VQTHGLKYMPAKK